MTYGMNLCPEEEYMILNDHLEGPLAYYLLSFCQGIWLMIRDPGSAEIAVE